MKVLEGDVVVLYDRVVFYSREVELNVGVGAEGGNVCCEKNKGLFARGKGT